MLRSIEVFAARTLRLVCVVHVHRKLVNCVAWHPEYVGTATTASPRASCLAAAGNDSVIHVVDLKGILGKWRRTYGDALRSSSGHSADEFLIQF